MRVQVAVGVAWELGPLYAWGRGPNGRDPWGLGVRLMVWPDAPQGRSLGLSLLAGPWALELGVRF